MRQPAYLTQEAGGFVFAYLGPEPAPLPVGLNSAEFERGTAMWAAPVEQAGPACRVAKQDEILAP